MLACLKSYAKINIFLKIKSILPSGYHELESRFVLFDSLFDELVISRKSFSTGLELKGDFGCTLEQNTIYKAYCILVQNGFTQVQDFFQTHKIEVQKNIPHSSGLGGGSSNAAVFMNFCNEHLNLQILKEELLKMGAKVGADVPFFLTKYKSANVFKFGEKVEFFEDDALELELFLNPIKCSTIDIFKTFDAGFVNSNPHNLCSQNSRFILENYDNFFLNDLLFPAVKMHKKLLQWAQKGLFFSGSGSSFFALKKDLN